MFDFGVTCKCEKADGQVCGRCMPPNTARTFGLPVIAKALRLPGPEYVTLENLMGYLLCGFMYPNSCAKAAQGKVETFPLMRVAERVCENQADLARRREQSRARNEHARARWEAEQAEREAERASRASKDPFFDRFAALVRSRSAPTARAKARIATTRPGASGELAGATPTAAATTMTSTTTPTSRRGIVR